MLGALGFLTLQQWRVHKLRLALTLLGVALGVAVYFAARTSSLILQASLTTTVEKIAGKATLQVVAGEAGFGEEILEIVRSTPGVEIAQPVIEIVARTAFEGGGDLLIVGVDTTEDKRLREYQIDESETDVENPLALVTRADSVVVSRPFAQKHNLSYEDKVPLLTPGGRKELTVRGIFKPVGVVGVLGGQVAVMDIYSARVMFNRGRDFDRIDLISDPNLAVEAVQMRLRARLPTGLDITRPSMRGQSMDNWVSAMNLGQQVMSYLALAVGVFLIFNSFSIAVNQRWKEIAILRALGVEARQIQRMFLGEAVVVGTAGSVLGVAGGFYLAGIASRVMATVAASTYGQMSETMVPVLPLDYAIESLAAGIGASLIAAWLPARAASRINPALSLHNIETRQREAVLGWRPVTAGLLMIGTGTALVYFVTVRVGAMFQFVYCVMILFGFVLLVPKSIELLAQLMRPVMDRVFGPEGVLALDSIVRSPRRSSSTVSAVMIGLSFVFSNGASIASHHDAIIRSVDRTIRADLLVCASTQLHSQSHRFDQQFAKRVAALDGISSIEIGRSTFIPYRGDRVALVATNTAVWLGRAGDILDEGDHKQAVELLPKGEGVIISRNFATRWKAGVGHSLSLDAPSGTIELPVVGIIVDYHSDKGSVFIDRSVYDAHWRDTSADCLMIYLDHNADPNTVKQAIQLLTATQQQALIYTNQEYKHWLSDLIGQFFALYYIQIVIAILVAAIGIINTLTISVSERRRELGVMRAIGGLRSQIRKIVLLEAMALTMIGVITGAASSAFNTYFLVHTAATVISGDSLPFRFPGYLILMSIVPAILLALAAGWWPAHRATRVRVIEALSYE